MKLTIELFQNLGVGVAILTLGIFLIRRQLAFQSKAKLATGIVKEILTEKLSDPSSRTGRQDTYYSPVVDFCTENGAVFTHRSSSYISPNRYTLGMELEILYDPSNPSASQLNNAFLIWRWPATFSILGTVFLTLGVVATIRDLG